MDNIKIRQRTMGTKFLFTIWLTSTPEISARAMRIPDIGEMVRPKLAEKFI
jgi:hypothetical protein